jgi:hypothetical protein
LPRRSADWNVVKDSSAEGGLHDISEKGSTRREFVVDGTLEVEADVDTDADAEGDGKILSTVIL